MALVAAAGPAANLALGLCAAAILFALTPLVRADLSERMMVTVVQPLVVLFALMLRFNIMLMFFNLIPIPPLDGGRILVGILPHRAALKVAAIEPFGFFVLIGLLILDRNVPILSGTIFPAADTVYRLLLPGYLPQGA
jgi:Zn-dependent protease